MLELRADLIDQSISDGLTAEEATSFVDENYVGYKRPPTGPSTIYINPVFLYRLGLRERGTPCDSLENAWVSGYQLSKRYLGSPKDLNAKIHNLKIDLIGSVTDATGDLELGQSIVDKYFVKSTKVRHDHGPVEYASPASIQLLEDGEVIRRRWTDKISTKIDPPKGR